MDVTPEHIRRIADFVEARIDEQFTGDNASRHWDKSLEARCLRALRRTVQGKRATATLAERRDPALALAVSLAMTIAWGELADVAKEWDDHPDYQSEFALSAHQLGATVVTEGLDR